MHSSTVLASSPRGDQVILFASDRLAIAFGVVMLPLTRQRLLALSGTLAEIAGDFGRYARDGLAYVHCDRLVLRFGREELADFMGLVIDALARLQEVELKSMGAPGRALTQRLPC